MRATGYLVAECDGAGIAGKPAKRAGRALRPTGKDDLADTRLWQAFRMLRR